MSHLSKRRIYVMDCGEFIKIGVSCNTEQRRNQLPCGVRQYYCTEPIENAFDIERFMHNIFSPRRKDIGIGREYFEVDFTCACNLLKAVLNAKKNRINFVIDSVKELISKNYEMEKFDEGFYKFLEAILRVSEEDLCLIGYVIFGLAARREMINKKELKEA